jgi:hypothetical protein
MAETTVVAKDTVKIGVALTTNRPPPISRRVSGCSFASPLPE